MGGTTWTKFYWSDWLSDPGLRRCSMTARGLWMDLLCYMAQHDPIGILAVQGEALSISDIARMTGIMETDASTLVGELERNGVFSRDRKGRIYSRRMVRDAKVSAEGRKNKLEALAAKPQKNNEKKSTLEGGLKADLQAHMPYANKDSSSAREDVPISGTHRVMALDLLDRGKTNLSAWERRFLESLCSKPTLTAKMQSTLDGIAAKLSVGIDDVMATWRKRLRIARQMQQWDAKWGPPPRKMGCLIPDQLLEPGDGDGWGEWRAAS